MRPERKVSARDVMALLRATYEGTPHDMCAPLMMVNRKGDTVQSPVANPWMTHDMIGTLNYLKPGAVTFHRGVSVAWCSYSFVAQMRSWLPDAVGGVVWMAADNPAESPRIPLFSGGRNLPRAFSVCGHKEYNPDTWLWQFRKANRLATVAWQRNKAMVGGAVLEEEEEAFAGMKNLEEQVKVLLEQGRTDVAADLMDAYTLKVYGSAALRWSQLEATFWQRAWAGF